MKMNDTVARIVEIMFQDVEMNEETAAIRDEVMNNCQERYTDLVNSGMYEDDAIAAVIESLKGMEDVLAPYKKKVRRHVKTDELDDDELNDDELDDEESDEREMIFAASEIHKIDLTLVNEDVTLEASCDDAFHVLWNADEHPRVQASVDNGVLKIDRRHGEAKTVKKERAEVHFKDEMSDFIKTENGSISINLDGLDSAMKNLGNSIKAMLTKNGVHINVGFCDTGVTILIPENVIPHVKLLTTSGDIEVQNVALADLNITSTNGDVNVDLNENQYLKLVEVRTTSGDIEATAYTHEMTIASTSGDVEVEGYYHNLTVNTISGDIDVRADVKNMTFKAVSGDVDLEFDSVEIRDVRGSTISGDIDIDLPDGIGEIAISTHTRSGDVSTRHHTNGVGPTVTGSVSSMSGDITIS